MNFIMENEQVAGVLDKICRTHEVQQKLYANQSFDVDLNLENVPRIGLILNTAIVCNNIKLVKLLIESGFDVNAPEDSGTSPLYLASILKNTEIASLLISAGADINYNCYGGPPQSLLRVNLMNCQLTHDFSTVTHFNCSGYGCAIHAACETESVKNIRFLLRNGADITMFNGRGISPFTIIKNNANNQLSDAHRIMMRHMAILIGKEQRVNFLDTNAIQYRMSMRNYYDKCVQQVATMKETLITSNTSFFSIFNKNLGKLIFDIEKKNFPIAAGIEALKNQCPDFCDELDDAYENFEKQRKLLSEREAALRELLEGVVPFLPLDIIVNYLYVNGME